MGASFLLAGGLTACGGGGNSLPSTLGQINGQNPGATQSSIGPAAQQNSPTPSATVRAASTVTGASYTAIDAGGAASGNWIADTDYSGSATWTSTVTNAINTSKVSNPALQAVYQSQRTGSAFTYAVPNLTPNAAYTVRLHFVESWFTSAAQRSFNVAINGAQVLSNFDIYKAAGGSNIAIAEPFTAHADATGKITVSFSAVINNASVAGIEITGASSAPTPVPATPTPVATTPPASDVLELDAGGGASGSWLADADATGGWAATVTNAINTSLVSNPAPQAVYQSQRAGPTLTYALPKLTPNAAYTVRLHFVESWFTSAGQRVFNVSINGAQALANFDIFKAAGGSNIAIAEPIATHADSSGKITIVLSATVNNASIAGIEVIGGASAPSSPAPKPSVSAVPTPAPVTSSQFPLPSAYFLGNTPFHHKIATLEAYGAAVASNSSSVTSNWWSAGIKSNNDPYQMSPLWIARSGDPGYTVHCTAAGYESGGCDANGKVVHFPSGARTQPNNTDNHILVIDPNFAGISGGAEVDLWGSDSPACAMNGGSPGSVNCAWGGYVPLNGNGLFVESVDPYSTGNAGRYAFALFTLTAQDLLNAANGKPISHALGMGVRCVDTTGGIYPSRDGADNTCQSAGVPTPNIVYGDVLHLKSSVNVPSLGGSVYCQAILQAYQTYGAYVYDTGPGYGSGVNTENPIVETVEYAQYSNPWYNTIEPAMQKYDGDGSPGTGFGTQSCLNHTTESAWETVHLNQAGDGGLPPILVQ